MRRLIALSIGEGWERLSPVDEYKPTGIYEVEFKSHSGNVRSLPSGVYFYHLRTDSFIGTKKIILMK